MLTVSSRPVSDELAAKINQPVHWLNAIALAYVLGGYVLGLVCIAVPAWPANILGVLLIAHTLVWAAYFVHEFMHGSIFRRLKWNAVGGRAMLFLTGSCYCRYRPLANYHMMHHKNRADFSAFSISKFLEALPGGLRQVIVGLEALYFPAVNFILRWIGALSPFIGEARRKDRGRNAALLLIRGTLFAMLGWYSLRALVLYLAAYVCFLNLLRFIDCFQHTFEVLKLGQPMPKYTAEYEELNTYSNIFPGRWPWLNLFFLNFGYHNAHHQITYCPWYLLPQLDSELYPSGYRQYVTLNRLVCLYHQHRVKRLFSGEGHVQDTSDGLSLEGFYGAIGVSFLVLREPLDWLKLPDEDSNSELKLTVS
ncbi:MAG: fatty acid desaturase [Cyanobacteria bacterium J06627_32]